MSQTSHPAPLLPHDQISRLQHYTACDISDALSHLSVPGAGFLADLIPFHPSPTDKTPLIAPVSTVLFEVAQDDSHPLPARNTSTTSSIPPGTHWVDAPCHAHSFVVVKQPSRQHVAVCGGIMALRLKTLRARGIIVAGRVRDVDELRSTGLPILAHGTSTVGSSRTNIPSALQQPLEINGVLIRPGDIAFYDPVNGVVIIPRDQVDNVLALLPDLVAADERVKQDVLKGMSVHEAFRLHRGK